jgi:hypothetical protein
MMSQSVPLKIQNDDETCVQYSTVQYSIVQCSAVQYSAVRCGKRDLLDVGKLARSGVIKCDVSHVGI